MKNVWFVSHYSMPPKYEMRIKYKRKMLDWLSIMDLASSALLFPGKMLDLYASFCASMLLP